MRYWHNGRLVEESTRTDDVGKARTILRQKMRTVGTPDFVPLVATRASFDDLTAVIRHDYTVVKKNRSLRRLSQSIAHLQGFFGHDKALAITEQRIDDYVANRQAGGAKASTINRELAALRRMFRLAVKKKLVPRACAPEITLLAEQNVREGFVEPADFYALCEAIREHGQPDVADAAEFAYLSLARRENVFGTKWGWFTLKIERGEVQGGTVRMPGAVTKNGKPLARILKGRLLDVIRRRWRLRIDACPYVFHRAGKRIVRFDGVWDAACEQVGLSGLFFHDLRRSGARNLRRAGKSEGVIMRMGGWKTASVFKRYDIVDEQDLADATDAYDDFLDRAIVGERKVHSIREASGA